jgi:hypothetical protein
MLRQEGAVHGVPPGSGSMREKGPVYRLPDGAVHGQEVCSLHGVHHGAAGLCQEGAIHHLPDGPLHRLQDRPLHGLQDGPVHGQVLCTLYRDRVRAGNLLQVREGMCACRGMRASVPVRPGDLLQPVL